MNMEMGNRLPTVFSIVDDEAKPFVSFVDSEVARDFSGGQEEVSKNGFVFRPGFADPRDRFFRNDENVRRGLRRDVFERETTIVFMNDVGRDLAGDDLFE